MKTLNTYLTKIIVLIVFSISNTSVYSQKLTQTKSGIVCLDTVEMPINQHFYVAMVSEIVYNENFKYRRALKKAKLSNKQYLSLNNTFSEVAILKYFKKGARRSKSVDEFTRYFHDRNLSFLSILTVNIISRLYYTFRKITFNGQLDILESIVGISDN